jgi:L-threonylcarbamoyladenylate synthase
VTARRPVAPGAPPQESEPDADIESAVGILRAGGLVAFPTETVYGLGCDATNPGALRRLYAVKGRPAEHPVIVHVADASGLEALAADVPDPARRLARAYWPGPLTVVVRRGPGVPDEVTGGRGTVGVRVPDQPVALALLRRFTEAGGRGVAAPSANRFGRVSPTTAADVRADLDGDVDLVLDGGPCAVGVESTIVDCSDGAPVILRLGGVSREQVEAAAGAAVVVRTDDEHSAPGTLPAHYAPDARVELVDAGAVTERAEAVLAGGARAGLLAPRGAVAPEGLPPALEVLDAPVDTDDYARTLYTRLREADRRGLDVLLAVPPAPVGIGAAVADRLHRAARAGVAGVAAEPGRARQ